MQSQHDYFCRRLKNFYCSQLHHFFIDINPYVKMDEINNLKRNSLSKSTEIVAAEIIKPKKPDGGYGK